jgi:Zn-dependent peptidase ImmA (M78 family)
MANNRRQIASAAKSLLTRSRISKLPVDLDAVLRFLDTRLLREEFNDDMSGLLLIKGGKRAIAVNAKHHRNRQRFTIAHEIGHFVLHHKDFEDPKNDLHWDKKWAYFRSTDSPGPKPEEVEANQFAAELLMPENLLRDAIRNEQIDLSSDIDTARLAELLQVSEQALTIRLMVLKMAKPY